MKADAIHPNPEIARRLAHIYTLHRPEIDLRLAGSPYLELLARLGNPHERVPPVIHVAGTNGKGSTLAILRAMLEAHGKRVHVYTSPHLLTFNERIRIAGQLISDADLIRLYDHVFQTNAGLALSFFEFTTALAFCAFAETKADYLLLETGVGGRLDCTNVIEKPLATAITKISYDHMALLGDTLEQIASEKAGIMKPGVPCVIGAQMEPETVMPVFENRAREIGATLIQAHWPKDYPTPNLVGAHQLENAATALALAAIAGIPEQAKREGLTHADWPGRMQRITTGPIAALLPEGAELWFDAAHNDSGAMALAAQLKTWKKEAPDRPIHLIVGMGANKDPRAFFTALAGTYDTLTLVDLTAALQPQTAKELQKKAQLIDIECKNNVKAAIESLLAAAPCRIVLAGSLYLYSDLRILKKNPL
jgi:dihydrofolate synthase/folylpolyglutamate synthase